MSTSKIKYTFFLLFLLPLLSQSQTFKSYRHDRNKVAISLSEGTISIYPLKDNVVRIRYTKEEFTELPELILLQGQQGSEFTISDLPANLEVHTNAMVVSIDKETGTLKFSDRSGNPFLSEVEGSRKLTPDSVMGVPCYKAEQSFDTREDEHMYGLGQFQDGHFNIKGVSRRLTQVNTQIAIPFLYSGKGYGLLWHQYGLTDFNPADNYITLERQVESDENNHLAEVTTTSGTQKIAQNQSLYTGKFRVKDEGTYSVFLDLGTMGNRHFVSIDGIPVIDQSNMWLPPTAGALVYLNAGEHHIQLICKSDNQPRLSWKLKDPLTTFRSPHSQAIDYLVFYGPQADTVIASYRELTGHAPLFPLWAYGFWQCRERYTSSAHLVETVKEFRKRNLPLDVIVQDWQYWGSSGWGVPQFDTMNYPNPPGFIKELHNLNARLNVSIWSNPDKNSTIGKEYAERNRFIPGTKWLDYFNPDTRSEYWNTLNTNMFVHGVDSWWMDAVEPENDALRGERTYLGPGDFYRLTYPLMVSKAVYEGQRKATSDKRVCILTRSAFSGQQRYGIINWSGDIGGDWDTYKRQIVAGLNYCISGLPYWTTDIGGFFRPGPSQYTDVLFHELLIRWFQWGAFNPIFRIHAYQTETEPWKYGRVVEDHMRKMMQLRYRLLPYIYSEAWKVTHEGSTMMRPMIMDFRDDSMAVDQKYQYMFGKALLVVPVITPRVTECEVYLPKGSLWYDFWNGGANEGGNTIKTPVMLDKIPLFVKAGSIIPLGKNIQYTGEKQADTLEIRIYTGANGVFTLYEDENDHYHYEQGVYSQIVFAWDNSSNRLTISDCMGKFPGILHTRVFCLKMITKESCNESEAVEMPDKVVVYKGKSIQVNLQTSE